jgi:3-oxoacyl-[acyl-carrier-protein] synthase II
LIFMSSSTERRVVVTGCGVISPLGNSREKLWEAICAGQSGIREFRHLPPGSLPSRFGAECIDFTGSIDDFGPLEKETKRNIKKGTKVMCREIQMGVAAAQLALVDAGLTPGSYDPDRTGCVYGCDYLVTVPEEFSDGIRNCTDAEGKFHFSAWGDRGLAKVDPLWLLKFLPNMPASHIAIYNDLRGPNNSLTMREAGGNAALAESYLTIVRGHADAVIAGAAGSRIHAMKSVQIALEEEVASGDDPATLIRPFDRNRRGLVLGEGGAALVVEEYETAAKRGAKILAEVIGYGSSTAVDRRGVAQLGQAIENVLRQALRTSRLSPDQVGHLHAHGLGTHRSDREEAQAIARVFAGRSSPVPVVAAKSYFGNLGAAGGLVELLTSLQALQDGGLFPVLNYETPDPECPVNVVRSGDLPAGDTVLNVSVSPQGQATAVVLRRCA